MGLFKKNAQDLMYNSFILYHKYELLILKRVNFAAMLVKSGPKGAKAVS